MHYATDLLVEEHQVIERMLEVLNAAAQKLEDGKAVDPDFFMKAGDFIRNFADKCHHAKEENILFKVLPQKILFCKLVDAYSLFIDFFHIIQNNTASSIITSVAFFTGGNAEVAEIKAFHRCPLFLGSFE